MSPVKSNWIKSTPQKIQTIIIKKSKRRVDFSCVGIRFQDRDTKQYVHYIPSLNISGYGSTRDRAQEMLDFSVEEFCTDLLMSSPGHANTMLLKLGWEHDRFKKKIYSTPYIDLRGNVDGFNAIDDKIELVDITTAA